MAINPFTDLVNETIEAKNLSGRRVAERANISNSYMALIRKGEFDRPPRGDIIEAIAKALDIPAKRLEDAAFATQRVTRVVTGPSRLHVLVDEIESDLSTSDLEEIERTIEALYAAKRKSRH